MPVLSAKFFSDCPFVFLFVLSELEVGVLITGSVTSLTPEKKKDNHKLKKNRQRNKFKSLQTLTWSLNSREIFDNVFILFVPTESRHIFLRFGCFVFFQLSHLSVGKLSILNAGFIINQNTEFKSENLQLPFVCHNPNIVNLWQDSGLRLQ